MSDMFKKAKVGVAGLPPAGTAISRERTGNHAVWNIPATGRSNGLLTFGWIWNSFLWLVIAVSVVADIRATKQSSETSLSSFWQFAILLPFAAIGIGILRAGYRAGSARHTVSIGDGMISLTREWRGSRKTKALPLSDVREISQVVFYSVNYVPMHGIEVKGGSGKLRFGSTLTEAEKAWLVTDFKNSVWPPETKE